MYRDIEEFKKQLIKQKQTTKLFAQEKQEDNLKGIIGNVFQSAFGSDLYKTIEEKAAHLLYFIIKNHPFTDGNKRVGAFVFIWFLQKAKFDYKDKITPEALTAITLFVAKSKPSEKNHMVGLILLMLKK
ncbi:MAG: Fic family protein [Parcubacteria group bacterium]|nr:Fic family protein [Parcubacteria group bacterium]